MRALPRLLRHGLTPAAAALAAALAIGCGGEGETAARPALIDQDRLNQYTCDTWNRADPAEQKAVVNTLHRFAGAMVTGRGAQGRGARLSDDHARRLFLNVCRERHARHFLLYKLYTHAAAFAGR